MRLHPCWLLGLGLLLAGTTGQTSELESDRDKAIAAIQKVGGKVIADDDVPGKPVVAVDFRRNKLLDSDLKHLEKFTQLKRLDLYDTGVTDAGLAHLAHLTQLQSLEVNGTKITDAGMKHLQKLINLKELYLYGTAVSDEGMEYLTKLTRLRILDVTATDVTAAGVVIVQKAVPKVKIEH